VTSLNFGNDEDNILETLQIDTCDMWPIECHHSLHSFIVFSAILVIGDLLCYLANRHGNNQ